MPVAFHYTGCYCGERDSVVPARVSALWRSRRERVSFSGRGDSPAGTGPHPARAHRLRLFPRQRRRDPARVVVSPRRLRSLVRRRARHAHERGPELGDPAPGRRGRRGAGRSRGPRRPRRLMRLRSQPNERIDRTRPVRFSFAGETISGLAGDTIASALYVAGRRVFSRSFKYHRPRGLLCCSGRCPNCMMTVDGVPNVRVCVEPLRPGVDVRAQNVLGSLDRDLLRVVDKIGGPFTPVGFYYRTMIRPRRAWPLYEKLLRNLAGLGRVGDAGPHRRYDTEHRRVETLVIGGGRSGRAAAAAAEGDVLLVDDRAAHDAPYEVLAPATALAIYEGGLVPVDAGDVPYRIRAGRIVVATGALEQPLVFPGNDLVGVMLPDAVRRLVDDWALKPGSRAVLVG